MEPMYSPHVDLTHKFGISHPKFKSYVVVFHVDGFENLVVAVSPIDAVETALQEVNELFANSKVEVDEVILDEKHSDFICLHKFEYWLRPKQINFTLAHSQEQADEIPDCINVLAEVLKNEDCH